MSLSHEPHELHGSQQSHSSQSWIDTWWPLLVILFGLLFISTLIFFHPSH